MATVAAGMGPGGPPVAEEQWAAARPLVLLDAERAIDDAIGRKQRSADS